MLNISKIIPLSPRFFRRHRLIRAWLRLTGEDPIQLVQFRPGQKAFIDLRDGFLRLILIEGAFDEEFFAIAEPFLLRGGHYLDVGANFGLCSFGLCESPRHGGVVFHMFEANPDLIPMIKRSFDSYSRHDLRVSHGCVSDRPGTSFLSVDPSHLGAAHVVDKSDVAVPNIVLDDYIRDCDIDRVSLMKIDIEGNEMSAFRGADAALRTGVIEAIFVEVFPHQLERQGSSPREVIQYLQNAGFELFYCRNHARSTYLDRNPDAPRLHLLVNDRQIEVVKITEGDVSFNTDILAVHQAAFSNGISFG